MLSYHAIPSPSLLLTASTTLSVLTVCSFVYNSLTSTHLHCRCSWACSMSCFPITASIHCMLNAFKLGWICILIHVEGGYIWIIQSALSAGTPKSHPPLPTPCLPWVCSELKITPLWAHGIDDVMLWPPSQDGRKVENGYIRLAVSQGKGWYLSCPSLSPSCLAQCEAQSRKILWKEVLMIDWGCEN